MVKGELVKTIITEGQNKGIMNGGVRKEGRKKKQRSQHERINDLNCEILQYL